MSLFIRSFFAYVGVVGLIALALFGIADVYTSFESAKKQNVQIDTAEIVIASQAVIGTTPQATSTPETEIANATISEPEENVVPSSSVTVPPPAEKNKEVSQKITRIENPYPFPPYSFETVNAEARSTLVNIQCFAGTRGVRSITASGVLIDSRGVILTNAHVAQHVLLSQSPEVNLNCTIYHGSPARALWKAEVLYISPLWVREHAKDIVKERSTGTGEYDYALLRITSALHGAQLPAVFPALPIDTREKIGFLGDTVLAASYPAEFLNQVNQVDLYPLTSIAVIRELLTFGSGSLDLFSVGGIAGAQGGSSGGSVVNAWGHVIGIITTTSEGTSTAERDLRAITLSYIDHDLEEESDSNIMNLLSGDLAGRAATFYSTEGSALIELLVKEIEDQTL